jgi:hypothetical protein
MCTYFSEIVLPGHIRSGLVHISGACLTGSTGPAHRIISLMIEPKSPVKICRLAFADLLQPAFQFASGDIPASESERKGRRDRDRSQHDPKGHVHDVLSDPSLTQRQGA